MISMSEPRDRIADKVREFERYGPKLAKAIDAVLAGGVKVALFLPSGRRVTTVVGRMGDEFIDSERPYCSCSSFFFQAQAGNEPMCYHLLAHRIALKLGMADTVNFSDEEYGDYLAATLHDVMEVLGKGGG